MPRRRTTVVTGVGLVAAGVTAVAATHLPTGGSRPAQPPRNAAGPAGIAGSAQPAVSREISPTWATLNPHASALRAAATAYALRFAAQWWAYDASRARPGHYPADTVLGRVAPFLDTRALRQAGAQTIPPAVWDQIVADHQRSTPVDLHAVVPTVWDRIITGPAASSIPPGTVMVTVTGAAEVSWSAGRYTAPDLALTVDVVCHPPTSPTAGASCRIDYLFPRVAR